MNESYIPSGYEQYKLPPGVDSNYFYDFIIAFKTGDGHSSGRGMSAVNTKYNLAKACGADKAKIDKARTAVRDLFLENLSILSTINETMHLARLQGATCEKVKNAFFANYLAALILLRLQDIKGLMLINDPSHSKLTKFDDDMSDVNFWGRAMFYPGESEIKSRLVDEHKKIVADSRIQKIMEVPLTAPDQVDWEESIVSLLFLGQLFELNSSYFNNIVKTLYHWDSSRDTDKKRMLNQSFMYLLQSDQQSKILNRIKDLSEEYLIQGTNKISTRIIGFKKLSEDGEGASTSTGAIASTSGANAIIAGQSTGSQITPEQPQDIQDTLAGLYRLKKKSPYQVTKKTGVIFKDGKIIKKKVKTFVARKFKAPDYLRVIKKGDK